MTKRRASIDIGSNSILLLIADVGEELKILASESVVTGLGRDLDKNGKFIQIAMDESFETLKKYKMICEDLQVVISEVIVTATEASRVSGNAKEFFKKVYDQLGFRIITITGEAEAYYSAQGVMFDKKIQQEVITIMDIGGASTELIKINSKQEKIAHSFSMPVGVVRMNNWTAENSLEKNLNMILKNFSKDLDTVKSKKLYCVAGTMTSVANMFLNLRSFKEEEINGLEIKTNDVKEMIKKYQNHGPEDFLKEFPFLGKRAKTIYSGLILAKTILDRLEVTDIYISTYGLRYATLICDSIGEEYVWKRE